MSYNQFLYQAGRPSSSIIDIIGWGPGPLLMEIAQKADFITLTELGQTCAYSRSVVQHLLRSRIIKVISHFFPRTLDRDVLLETIEETKSIITGQAPWAILNNIDPQHHPTALCTLRIACGKGEYSTWRDTLMELGWNNVDVTREEPKLFAILKARRFTQREDPSDVSDHSKLYLLAATHSHLNCY
jgi:hypothetical protein